MAALDFSYVQLVGGGLPLQRRGTPCLLILLVPWFYIFFPSFPHPIKHFFFLFNILFYKQKLFNHFLYIFFIRLLQFYYCCQFSSVKSYNLSYQKELILPNVSKFLLYLKFFSTFLTKYARITEVFSPLNPSFTIVLQTICFGVADCHTFRKKFMFRSCLHDLPQYGYICGMPAQARSQDLKSGGGYFYFFFFFFLPFFPQTVYWKNIEVIEVCPTNLWKSFPIIKKKGSDGRKQTLFLVGNCTPMRANASQMQGKCATLRHAHFCRPLPGSEPTQECEANAWRTQNEPAKSAFLMAFFESPSSIQTNLC